MKQTCFVVMGYGKKMDYATGKTVDLDKVYKTIIQPVVVSSGYRCVRGDEVKDPSLIDRSMYALLMHAELVIADVTTFNPNAVYELGVRHAVKPYSTIIMMDSASTIPFDINHCRIIQYKNEGLFMDVEEVERVKTKLSSIINDILANPHTDSPLYTYIKGVDCPQLPQAEFDAIITDLAKEEVCLYAIVEKAQRLREEEKWEEALMFWSKAVEKKPKEEYYLQQKAYCTYMAKLPSPEIAYNDALIILGNLPQNNNSETLGLLGAVYKRMYELHTDDLATLDRAIDYYGKGYKICGDYYTGENYAYCLYLKSKADFKDLEDEERIYSRFEAKKVWKDIIKRYLPLEDDVTDLLKKEDGIWIIATISSCLFALNDERHAIYEKYFLEYCSERQKNTYIRQKQKFQKLL